MTSTWYYIAVRRVADAGYEWLDPDTLSGDRVWSQQKADASAAMIPQWTAANPVVRIARVTVTEDQQ